MKIEEIEKTLDALERLDELSDEQITDLVCQSFKVLYSGMTLDKFLELVFKPYMLQNPEQIRAWMGTYKDTLLRRFREALKIRRRQAKIRRK